MNDNHAEQGGAERSDAPVREVWYRVVDGRYATVDEWGDAVAGGVYVQTHEFEVLRHTPKGVWLADYGKPRFVLRDARKRYACPTREEAVESFRARKERQARILRSKLEQIEDALRTVEPASSQSRAVASPATAPLPKSAVEEVAE